MKKKKSIVKKIKRWEIFENDCFCYLKDSYLKDNINFIKAGKSNSKCSDIKVLNNNKDVFNIEIKMKTSQSSQFALRIEDDKFAYSNLNQNENNKYSKEIIDYLNLNYEQYKYIKQNSVKIGLTEDLYKKWIISHYNNSNIKFIITGDKNNKIILPIENIDKYFKIECFLRKKKSGSRKLPKSDFEIVKDYIDKNISKSFNIFNIDKEFYIEFNTEIKKDIKFKIENNIYMISPCNNSNVAVIRKLGNTNNPTIIFSLKLYNNKQYKDDLNKFLYCIKKDDK